MKPVSLKVARIGNSRGVRLPAAAKTRPVVIGSLDVLDERLPTVTVCPLSSQVHPGWRTRIQVLVARRQAEIVVDQIRTISKSRLGRKLGGLFDADAAALRRLTTEMYGE